MRSNGLLVNWSVEPVRARVCSLAFLVRRTSELLGSDLPHEMSYSTIKLELLTGLQVNPSKWFLREFDLPSSISSRPVCVQALARSIPPNCYQIAVAAVVARSPPQVCLCIVERLLDALLERLDPLRYFLIAMGKRPPLAC